MKINFFRKNKKNGENAKPESTPVSTPAPAPTQKAIPTDMLEDLKQKHFDAYGILGVDKKASKEEIDKTYNFMMKKLESFKKTQPELEGIEGALGAVSLAHVLLTEYRDSYDAEYDTIMSQKQDEPEHGETPDDETPNPDEIKEEFLDSNGDFINAYDILKIDKDATNKDILDAYEKAKKGIKTKKTKELARKACDILLNNKAEYDETLSKVQPTAQSSSDTTSENKEELTEAEKEYRELEAKTKEAFKKAQEAKTAAAVSKYKEKSEELAKKKKEAEEEAKKAAEERKKQKELQKDAKDKAKEARKQLRKAKSEEKKNARAKKKAEKAIETVNKKADKRKVLIRKPMSGKLKKGLIIGTSAAVLIGATATTTVLIVNHKNNKKFDDNKKPAYEDQTKDVPSPTPETYPEATPSVTPTPEASPSETPETDTPQTEISETQAPVASEPITTEEVTPDMTEITEDAKVVYENWIALGSEYTEENVVELIKCLRGYESSISVDDAVAMIDDTIFRTMVPGVDNLQAGENIAPTNPLNIADLVADSDEAKDAIDDIQYYVNAILADVTNREASINEGLERVVRVIVNGETVDGFNSYASSPAAKIVWSEAVTCFTSLARIQNEDAFVIIDGVEYSIDELANTVTYTNIINSAKRDLGSASKVPVL